MKKSLLKLLINNLREDIPIQIINFLVYLQDFFYSPPNTNIQSQKSILIARTDLMGDFIVWFNALKFIAKKYKKENYKVILLGNEVWTALAEKTKVFDEIIPINRKKYFKDFSYRKNILNELNKHNFDYLFQTAYSRDFAVADSITRNVKAKNKIAFRRNNEAEYSIWNLLSNNWYSKLISVNKNNLFEFFRVKEFLTSADITIEKYSTDLSAYFQKNSTGNNYFVVLPGANAARRCLEPEKFAKLINRISEETGWQCILCGSKGETVLGNLIESKLNFKVQNLIGKTSLVELGNVLANSKFVLGNETGTLHLASALNVPSASILGGGHFKRFMPYNESIANNEYAPLAIYNEMDCFNCNWRCIYVDEKNRIVPCVSRLSTDYIWKEINPSVNKSV